MNWSRDSLQVVVVYPPYDSLGNRDTQNYLLKVLTMKLKSYQNVYPDGVMPLDTYDFISTHVLIGVNEVGGEFVPLMVFRTTALTRCQRHRLPFPGVAVMRSSGAERHAEILEKKLQEWSARGEQVTYDSGWCLAPVSRSDREFREVLKELMAVCLLEIERESKSDHMIACGVIQVHSDEYLQSVGYERVKVDGDPLPPFPQSSLIDTPVVVLESVLLNGKSDERAERYKDIWDRRLRIGVQEAEVIPLRPTAASDQRKKAA